MRPAIAKGCTPQDPYSRDNNVCVIVMNQISASAKTV